MKLIPLLIRLCGFPRLMRGSAMADAMEKNHPAEPHFYLAFVAVAPRLQGMGLGGALLEATVKRADDRAMPAYLENSNPRTPSSTSVRALSPDATSRLPERRL